jgi:hypothetical protein
VSSVLASPTTQSGLHAAVETQQMLSGPDPESKCLGCGQAARSRGSARRIEIQHFLAGAGPGDRSRQSWRSRAMWEMENG